MRGQEKVQTEGTAAKALSPRAGGAPDCSVTDVRREHPAKAEPPMEARAAGRVMEASAEQLAKAEAPMEEREAGRETEERAVQLAKALGAMAVTG
jgi:hypothetical protein